jgi:vancomycin permeability regulator SanA
MRLFGVMAMVSVAGVGAVAPVGLVHVVTRRQLVRSVERRSACVCVLGARVWPNGNVSTVLLQRLQAAATLAERNLVATVFVSGDDTAPAHHEATTMRQWLIEHHVDASMIVDDAHGWSTATSCRNLASAMAAGSVPTGKAVIATQSFVAARTAYMARRAGLDAVVLVLPTRGLYAKRVLARMIIREIPACWKAVLHLSKGVDGFARRRAFTAR